MNTYFTGEKTQQNIIKSFFLQELMLLFVSLKLISFSKRVKKYRRCLQVAQRLYKEQLNKIKVIFFYIFFFSITLSPFLRFTDYLLCTSRYHHIAEVTIGCVSNLSIDELPFRSSLFLNRNLRVFCLFMVKICFFSLLSLKFECQILINEGALLY